MKEAPNNKVNPRELVAYYKEHTLKETAKYFKIGQAKVREVCLAIGFKKPTHT